MRYARALQEYEVVSSNIFAKYQGRFNIVSNKDKQRLVNSMTKLSNTAANLMRRNREIRS
jgi:hypothetical protein